MFDPKKEVDYKHGQLVICEKSKVIFISSSVVLRTKEN